MRWVAAGGGASATALADLNVPIDPPPAIAPQAALSDGVLAMGAAVHDVLAVTADGTNSARLQTLVTAGDLLFGAGASASSVTRAISG